MDDRSPRPSDSPARADVLRRGAVVGRLVVLHRLGAGGMGVVYAAYDPGLGRKVALKVLLPGSRLPNARARLLREAQSLAKVSHPGVVGIHDVGTMGDQVWVAMEYVEGQTLRAWLQAPRHWREVLAVMREAGRGLVAAHAANLLHRDFKPDNVMIGDDGRVRVMDFGLARARSRQPAPEPLESKAVPAVDVFEWDMTRTGVFVGTRGYLAPEQGDEVEPTEAVDQFSFCVTLWEALYGERPFKGRNLVEFVGNVVAGRLCPPPKDRDVPAWLRFACERGLAARPEDRWPSMHALLEALAPRPARGRRRWMRGAGLLLALGLSVGAAEVVSAWGRSAAEFDLQIAQREDSARLAASAAMYVYPPPDQPDARTALVELGELEALEHPLARKAAEVLREEFAAALVSQGDRYWDDPQTRFLATDYYASARLFEPSHPVASARAPMLPSMLIEEIRRAHAGEFTRVERLAAEPMRLLMQEDGPGRRAALERVVAELSEYPEGRPSATQIRRLLSDRAGSSSPIQQPSDGVERERDEPNPADCSPGEGGPDEPEPEDVGPVQSPSVPPPPGPSVPPSASDTRRLIQAGRTALTEGRRAKAESLFLRALERDAGCHRALHGLARVEYDRAHYPESARYARRAVDLAPKRRDYRLLLGDTYFKTKRYQQARVQYQRALDRGHPDAAERLRKVESKLRR